MTSADDGNRPSAGPAGTTPHDQPGRICPVCGTKNTSESRFCGSCAAPLKDTAAPVSSLTSTRTVRASTVDLTRGSRLADRYEIIEELGRGGMGKVFKVFDHKVNEVIALKLIRPEISVQEKAIERFKNELKYTRKIAHRNICRMFDLGESESLHFITMEFVAGEDLKRFVKRAGALNAAKAVAIGGQVCEGLAEAHRIGAIHRDLKPQNIMIDGDGNAKIMDFGIARFTEMDRMTGSGVMIGTPDYMSPEQADLAEVDARSDIYSLGVVLYEMVTGRVPFEGPTPLSLAMKHKMEKPKNVREWNAQIPAALAAIVARCLEKDPDKRYQTAVEMGAALREVEKDLETGERAVSARAAKTKAIRMKTEKTGGRKLVPLIAAGVLVIAAAAAYVLFLRPTPVILPTEIPTAADTGGSPSQFPVDPRREGGESLPPAAEELKSSAPETKAGGGKTALVESKTGSNPSAVQGAGDKPAGFKPTAVDALKLSDNKPPAANAVKTDPAGTEAPKPQPAESEEKKAEVKPKTAAEDSLKTSPAAKNSPSVVTEADKVAMYAAQSRAVAARNQAREKEINEASLFFSAADGVQRDAAVSAAENKVADAECGFVVAETLYRLCLSEGNDRARWRELIRHIDGRREKALAAWNNVEGDPLFAEARSGIARGETARRDDRAAEALRAYAGAAVAYEKILWIAGLTKK